MVKMSGVPFCRSWVWLVHGRLAKGLFRLELPVCLDSSVSSCGPLPVFNECRVLGGTLAGGTQLRKFSTSGQKDATNETNATGNMVRVDSPNKPNISYDRNFITTTRALTDFMLKPTDLKSLRVTTRRSPNEVDPPLSVYWRKDVEAKAREVWGSLEAMEIAREKRELQDMQREQFNSLIKRFAVRRRQKRLLQRENWPIRPFRLDSEPGLQGSSGKVVLAAIGINSINCFCKFGAWVYTGSHALFSEAVHSLADTLNQVILAYGIHKSIKKPNEDHPYGYSNMQYVSSLISGVGIFFLGSGLSVYHGIAGLIQPHDMESIHIGLAVLGASFLSENITLGLAIRSIRESASAQGMGLFEYVIGGYDPCVNVVLLEDMAAVLGVVIAGGAMGLSFYTGSHIPDAVGSIMIGGLLATVAGFMVHTNTNALVGRSIPEDKLRLINKELEGDIMVRQVQDVKGIDMGNGIVRYKAELDIDGRELAKYYLQKNDLPKMLLEVQAIKTENDLNLFILRHGENIVDCLGEQVDRIEKQLKAKHPEVKHVDLEVL